MCKAKESGMLRENKRNSHCYRFYLLMITEDQQLILDQRQDIEYLQQRNSNLQYKLMVSTNSLTDIELKYSHYDALVKRLASMRVNALNLEIEILTLKTHYAEMALKLAGISDPSFSTQEMALLISKIQNK